MTETIEIKKIEAMPVAVRRFILQWGDMGTTWGVNRSVAQIHALLYIIGRPLHAEEIADTLGIARSNVSNSLKELMGWKIVVRTPIPGDRRDHFTADGNAADIAMKIAAIRKQREIDPALETLEICLRDADGDEAVTDLQRARLEDLQDLHQNHGSWYGQMLNIPTPNLMRMVKMGTRS